MADDRYDVLGIGDTSQAAAADAFYGGVPQTYTPQYGGGNMRTPADFNAAYEKNIIRELSQLDPRSDDYTFQVQEYIANNDDPNVASYDRVKQFINANLGRNQQLLSKKNSQRDMLLSVVEEGWNPERLSELQNEDGSLNDMKVAYARGELKRNPTSGKWDNKKLLNDEDKLLTEALTELNLPISDEEKLTQIRTLKGNEKYEPVGNDWRDIYNAIKNPRIAKAQAIVMTLQQKGRSLPPEILQAVGIQESATPAASTASQSIPTDPYAVPSTTGVANVTPTGVTASPADLTRGLNYNAPTGDAFQRAAQVQQDAVNQTRYNQQQEATVLQNTNQQSSNLWEKAKMELASNLNTQIARSPSSDYLQVARLLGKDPAMDAFVDASGQAWTWGEVARELLNDPRTDQIRKGIDPSSQKVNIKSISQKQTAK